MAHDGAPGTGGKEEGAPLILGLAMNLPLTKSTVFNRLSSSAFSDRRAVCVLHWSCRLRLFVFVM